MNSDEEKLIAALFPLPAWGKPPIMLSCDLTEELEKHGGSISKMLESIEDPPAAPSMNSDDQAIVGRFDVWAPAHGSSIILSCDAEGCKWEWEIAGAALAELSERAVEHLREAHRV